MTELKNQDEFNNMVSALKYEINYLKEKYIKADTDYWAYKIKYPKYNKNYKKNYEHKN